MTMQTSWGCNHSISAVCFRCSDQVWWWREARIRAGYPREPLAIKQRREWLEARAKKDAEDESKVLRVSVATRAFEPRQSKWDRRRVLFE